MDPAGRGLEVCRRIKANPATKAAKVMLVATQLTGELESDARKAGVDDCTEKPIDFAEVMKLLGVDLEQ